MDNSVLEWRTQATSNTSKESHNSIHKQLICLLEPRPAEHGANGKAAAYHRMSIKFSDHDHDSPFDLLLSTGRHAPYFNAATMDQFHAALKSANSDDMKQYLLSMPVW